VSAQRFCVCRRLVDQGLADLIDQESDGGQAVLATIWDCIESSGCPEMAHARGETESESTPAPPAPTPPPAPPADAEPPPEVTEERKKGRDRRLGDRRKKNVPVAVDRRKNKDERRKGDRRGLKAGQSYTPEQMVANLTAWCEAHCEGAFKIGLEGEGAGRQLSFNFDIETDRMNFMAMLRNWKRPKISL